MAVFDGPIGYLDNHSRLARWQQRSFPDVPSRAAEAPTRRGRRPRASTRATSKRYRMSSQPFFKGINSAGEDRSTARMNSPASMSSSRANMKDPWRRQNRRRALRIGPRAREAEKGAIALETPSLVLWSSSVICGAVTCEEIYRLARQLKELDHWVIQRTRSLPISSPGLKRWTFRVAIGTPLLNGSQAILMAALSARRINLDGRRSSLIGS